MRAVGLALILTIAALLVTRMQRLRIEKEVTIAVVRAAVQLSIVAWVIGAVFEHLGFSALFVMLMYGAATWTAGHRLKGIRRNLAIAAASVAAGAAPSLILLFGLGGYPIEPRFIIPIAGILIGGCMTATTLSGRRIRDEMTTKVAEIEARLSLGVTAKYALRSYLPASILSALIPVLDQTKNVGVITLPGAFVGMILGGASPVEAAQVQLTVLFSLLGAQTVSAAVSAVLVGRSFVGPGERMVVQPPMGEAGE